MGVTIHFEGQLKNEDSFGTLLHVAKQFCDERAWPYVLINEPHAKLSRVRNEEDFDYEGAVKGIKIQPHENSEPFRLEFDEDLYVQEYTKTQFSPIEIHVDLINFLVKVTPYFNNLEVNDEGEFFDTNDIQLLSKHINRCFEMLEEYLVQDDKYYGPVQLASGRIVDVMSRE